MPTDATDNLHDFPPEPGGGGERSFLRLAVIRDRTQLRIPSRVDWIELAVMYLANKAENLGVCDHDRHGKIVTALTEAITNAIVHGNLEIPSSLKEQPGAFARALAERSSDPAYAERLVEIEMAYDGQRCEWIITDQGAGFDVGRTLQKLDADPDPDAPGFDPASLLCSGRGILLMRAFLDDVSWSQGGRRVCLAIERESPDERRASPRVHTAEPLRAIPLDDEGKIDWDRAFDALATDVSAGGIGILRQGLASGSVQRLVLELKLDGRSVYVPAEVCHVESRGGGAGGMVQIGCRFAIPAPGNAGADAGSRQQQTLAVETLLDRLTAAQAPAQDERRTHPRVAYTKAVRLLLPDGRTELAVARDLSKSGMAFVTEFAIPRGTTFDVLLEPEGETPLRLRAQAIRCNRMAGAFHDIGCRFLD